MIFEDNNNNIIIVRISTVVTTTMYFIVSSGIDGAKKNKYAMTKYWALMDKTATKEGNDK